MQILEHRHERPLGREVMHHLDDSLEQVPGLGVGPPSRRSDADLGEEPRQLRAPHWCEPRHQRVVVGHSRAPQRIDPRGERQRLLGFVAPSQHDLAIAGRRDRCDLRREPALADARLAEKGDEASIAIERLSQGFLEDRELGVPAHQGRLRRRRDESRRRGRRHGPLPRRGTLVDGRGLPAQDLLVERLRLRFRLGVELALESGDADLVLVQGGAAAPELGVETHERAVHGLVERIERQDPESRLHGGLGRTDDALLGEELGKGAQGKLVQALALAQQPLLERRLVQGESGEEVALVESGGLLQRLEGASLHVLLEGQSIDGDRRRIEGDGLRVGAQNVYAGQGPANGGQRLAQARAGLGLAHVAPEQRGDLVAGVRLTERQSEVGEQGLRFPRRQHQRRARHQSGAEALQECQVQSRHRGIQACANLITSEAPWAGASWAPRP